MKICSQLPVRHYLLILTLLFGWGVAKLQWEHRLLQEQELLRYHGVTLTRTVRDQLGQGATIATLAGMRALVANYIWCCEVEPSWERREWFKLKEQIELVTTLEPRSVSFWDEGAWHLAWNAALDRLRNPDQPIALLRLRDERFWVDQGIEFLRRGIQNNPEKMDLWWKLGWLYDQRKKDYLQAAACFQEALKRPHPPQYLERFVGYELEKGEDYAAAYAWWKGLWFSTTDRSQKFRAWDIVELHIRRLENRLGIPPEKRVFPQPASH